MCRAASTSCLRTRGALASWARGGPGGRRRRGRRPPTPWRCAAGARRLSAGRRVAAVARCDTASGGPRPAADFLRRVVRRLPPPRRRYGLQHRRRSRRPSSAKNAARAAANQQPDAIFHLSGGPQAAGEGPMERATARAPGVATMRATRSAPRMARSVVQIVALERATPWSQARALTDAPAMATRRGTTRALTPSQSVGAADDDRGWSDGLWRGGADPRLVGIARSGVGCDADGPPRSAHALAARLAGLRLAIGWQARR